MTNPETVTDMAVQNPTTEDAESLGRVYRRLMKLSKAHKKADRDTTAGWVDPDAKLSDLRVERDLAQSILDDYMDQAWEIINGIPNGTVASGGATPQTVGLEFFNRSLNRNLGLRLSASAARQINRRSFG